MNIIKDCNFYLVKVISNEEIGPNHESYFFICRYWWLYTMINKLLDITVLQCHLILKNLQLILF
ncbi:hypothetical protein AR454_09915 [Bacillus mycoides]|nr:hypothetical protein [Bacillus mycoides]